MTRIAVAGFLHETNTFAPKAADRAAFVAGGGYIPMSRGKVLMTIADGVNLGISGAISVAGRRGWDIVPVMWAGAIPSAAVTREAYESIAEEILDGLARAAPLDGVFLDLHGAMVAEHVDDGEGELARRVRDVIGADTPLVAALDLHANLSESFVDAVDIAVGFRTYPHVDMARTGERAAELLHALANGGPRPAKAFRRLPYLVPIPLQSTDTEPGATLYADLAEREAEGAIAPSLFMGFPAADVPDCGPVALAYGATQALADRAAERIAADYAAAEERFTATVPVFGAAAAVDEARRRLGPDGPVILADTQDNPGAGGVSATTGLLRALIEADVPETALGLIVDPDSAAEAHRLGVGATARFRLGGHPDLAAGGEALDLTATVEALHDGPVRLSGPYYGGTRVDFGPSACLRVGGVRVVLTSAVAQMADREMFRFVGIEPDAMAILAVKSSTHFRADFAPIAGAILIALAPGPMPFDPAELPFTRLRPGLRLSPGGPGVRPRSSAAARAPPVPRPSPRRSPMTPDTPRTPPRTPPRRPLGAAALLSAATLLAPALAAAQGGTSVTAVMHSGLRVLDPVITTAHITRNHAYMIYDVLTAVDENFEPQPQMADWTVSEDELAYTFTLRDGLTFHDGEPVTAEDVVASLERWGVRDTGGQLIFDVTASLEATDERTVTWTLSEPFPPLLTVISKQSAVPPFIMPARVAATSPDETITEYVGSGPFVFDEAAYEPGVSVTYEKFEDYVPREEPASWMAGGKIVNVDQVVWTTMPDALTAMNALAAGEIDYVEQVQVDLLPILENAPGVTVEVRDPLGYVTIGRPNFLYPPFDDVKVRQAALAALGQEDVLATMMGDPDYYDVCGAVFGCGTPLADESGSDPITGGPDPARARALLEEAGYDGTPIVLMQPTDVVTLSNQPVVAAQALRQGGFEVDMQPMDWQSVVNRRAMQSEPDEGGWNLFFTNWMVPEVSDPLINVMMNGRGDEGWFGWPDDPEIETMRSEFAAAEDDAARKEIATRIQAHVMENVNYLHLGEYRIPQARRDTLQGMLQSPVPVFWNVTATAE